MTSPAVQRDPVCSDCPGRGVLADLVLGKLPGEAIEQLSRHIETCSICQDLLDTLDALEDSMVADLKAASRRVPTDTNLEPLIQDVARIGPAGWGGGAHRPTEADDFAGHRLGQYELQEQIGRGGMGTVYKALHVRLKRHVAVKLLSGHRPRDPQALARFAREMEAVGRLDHPNLVRAHDAGDADGLHYLTMELLDGSDLSRIVRKHGPLGVADACEVVQQAALALQHAHEHGLVHRDVKPSNLMLTMGGQVKVLDLGLARLTTDTPQADEMTGTNQAVGTGDFIAPEQGQDARSADARSDIYALACTLYFLLAGRGPFAAPEYATFMQKVMAHAKQPVPSISQFRDDLPSGLVAILQRMLHKDPDQRFQTAAEVAQALELYAAGSDLPRVAAGSHRQVLESPAPKPASHGQYMRLTLLLLAIAVGGFAYWRAEIILLIRGNGVLVVTGERAGREIVVTPSAGSDVTLQLDDRGIARLRAGQYGIRISGDSSGATVKPAQFEIHLARQTVVEIRRSADLPPVVADAFVPDSPSESDDVTPYQPPQDTGSPPDVEPVLGPPVSRTPMEFELTTLDAPGPAFAIDAGDLNRDGHIDIVCGYAKHPQETHGNFVFWGEGNRRFRVEQGFGRGAAFRGIRIADLTGSGRPDVLVLHALTNYESELYEATPQGFVPRPAELAPGSPWGGNACGGLAVGDLDGDGHLDAASGHRGGYACLSFNDGQGTLRRTPLGDTGAHNDVEIGDLDGDGALDVLDSGPVGGWQGTSVVYWNNGDGTFTETTTLCQASTQQGASLGDIDGDGDLDIAIGRGRPDASLVLRNDGGRQFTVHGQLESHFDVVLADLDGNGTAEAVTTGNDDHPGVSGQTIRVYWDCRADGRIDRYTLPGSHGAGMARCLVVADVDNDTRPDIVVGGETNNVFVIWGSEGKD